MKKNKLEKTGIIFVFAIVAILLSIMGYQVGIEVYNSLIK